MGKVATTFKIMPESADVDMDVLESKLRESIDVSDSKIEPIAFGLKALIVMVVTEDSEGGIGEIEEKIRSIENISDVEAISSTLV